MSDKKTNNEDVFVIKKDYVYLGIILLLVGILLFQNFGVTQTKETVTQPNNPTQPKEESKEDVEAKPQLPVIDDLITGEDPALGNPNAPIVVIEYSDFQCPYCRKFFTDTFDQIKKNYIDTGKVYWVYKDFPLSFHDMAIPSALAVQCAKDQGKEWELHDKIFEEQAKLGVGTIKFTTDDLMKWVSEVGLDMDQFQQCIESGKYNSEVEADFKEGINIGVQGTPTFYIAKRGSSGKLLVGAQPYVLFEQAIKQIENES